MSRAMNVATAAIRENQVALRSVNKETEDYVGLRDSMKQVGILNPINVIPSQEAPGAYELVDGLHRFTAAKELGMTEIPVNVLDINEGQVALAQIIGNVHKVETKPVEYSRQLVRILGANPTWTQNELAVKLGVSSAFISERLNLLKLDGEIGKLVDEGKVPLLNAYTLAKLPVAEQKNYIDAAMTQSSTEFGPTINARVKELKDAARQGREANPPTFVPIAHARKMLDIKAAIENPGDVVNVVTSQGFTSPADVITATLKWVLSLDPQSLQAAKDKYDAREKEKAENKAKREAEKKAKQEAAAAEAAAKLQGTTNTTVAQTA